MKILISVACIVVLGFGIYGAYSLFDTKVPSNQERQVTDEMVPTVQLEDGAVYPLMISAEDLKIIDREQPVFTYNGTFPGPVLVAQEGTKASLKITNMLEEETLLHPHGLRLENKFDGTPNVQDPIQPGETFVQELVFPDPGVFWYHTHMREDRQQEFGLYGMIIVEPKDEDYYAQAHMEVPLFLDDAYVAGGKIAPVNDDVNRTLMGRFGNRMLVNGDTYFEQTLKRGSVVRYFVGNAANVRTFNLSFANAKMKLVGDDNGVVEKEQFIDSVLISPSERVIVDVLFDAPGPVNILHITPENTYALGRITVEEDSVDTALTDSFMQLRTNDALVALRTVIAPYMDSAPDKVLRIDIEVEEELSESMKNELSGLTGVPCHVMPGGWLMGDCDEDASVDTFEPEPIEWEDAMETINWQTDNTNIAWKLIDVGSGKANSDIDWNFTGKEYTKISIFNDPKSDHPMQHPIHFHGQRFLVLKENGAVNTNLAWQDTVLVKTGDTTEILLETTNPGEWMAHCHIAEHLENGMMFTYSVS